MIDEDIEEGREHLDMSHDFPFQSKKMDFLEYMDELKEVVESGEMPLLSYRLIHWGTTLTKPESDQIVKWVNDSLWLFKDDPKAKKK